MNKEIQQVGSDTKSNRNIYQLWVELINHPDFIYVSPNELITVQSVIEKVIYELDSERSLDGLSDIEKTGIVNTVVENREFIRMTLGEYYPSDILCDEWWSNSGLRKVIDD